MKRSDLKREQYDAVVVGSGPNGLAAAIRLAQSGYSTLVVEGAESPGGGARNSELTLPGFRHDICSAVHPMALASPFFSSLPLSDHGLEWIQPDVPLAHPLDDEGEVAMMRSIDDTAEILGRDGRRYRKMFSGFVEESEDLFRQLLGPIRIPRKPLRMARFGRYAMRPALSLALAKFSTAGGRALFAGQAAHSVMPLNAACSSAIGMMLSIAGHAVGWPIAKGGSGSLTGALCDFFSSLGGELVLNWKISRIEELPQARAYLFDTSPGTLASITRDYLPASYLRRIRKFRHGAGIFKMDWALDAPIPWKSELARRAGTVHVGGTLGEISHSEGLACSGRGHPEHPFVLLSQPTVFDSSRAPKGKHIAWGYCHVPAASCHDMTEQIESQIERFAPGFKDCISARSIMNSAAYEDYNPNLVGGDITGGMNHWSQLFTRPVVRWNPYTTPRRDIYICSASTPPGGGVHGMCGFWAAQAAIDRLSASQ
ncbi:MAG: NAD(P)/FAD-dependent oxidoreductase [Verrucomicrobiales bacterium]